ncbi:hypothetical protein AMS68_005555 [Peltaster fructicola]|uniref:dolichol kinase n=1 Tax=Peltaster fructicola TaxID=286661 RepID=A0A6H0XZL6_9PEZI|nr:hypothetical protein AMS68_005555 [Peltaster fructicola]
MSDAPPALQVPDLQESVDVSEAAELRTLDRSPHLYHLSFNDNRGHPRTKRDGTRVRRRRGVTSATGSSESGTEADDETETIVKALPAPQTKPSKGLKVGEKDEDTLLTPSQLDDEGRRLEGEGYFSTKESMTDAEESKILLKRRLGEFARRCSEVGLMVIMLVLVLCGRDVWSVAKIWRYELLANILIMAGLVAAYPVKLSLVDTQKTITKPWQRFRVPASFDPATVLYPPLLPVMVALIVSPISPTIVLPNIILGLAALPQRLFPRSSRLGGYNALHWLISILPLVIGSGSKWLGYVSSTADLSLSTETLVSLYPLHHALLPPLHYLTTNSLLISELHLLSIALINLLLFARAPQSTILKACLWIGGVSLFACTERVLHWNVILARVPRWKLRRPGHPDGDRRSLLDAAVEVIHLQRATRAFQGIKNDNDSDADEDHDPHTPIRQERAKQMTFNQSTDSRLQQLLDQENNSIVSDDPGITETSRPLLMTKSRRNTLPAPRQKPELVIRQDKKRTKARNIHRNWCLQLTSAQVDRRKMAYAAYVYGVIIIIVLLPVRVYVSDNALYGSEAVGWAIGYLFGQLPVIHNAVDYLGLDLWITMPLQPSLDYQALIPDALPLDMVEVRGNVGAANMHLLLIAYWVLVLVTGLVAVFTLTPYVEVDTRRKIFHGVMVAMFLPATFVDPCYCALALALVLTIFLLLEVIRAAQIAPLGTAIGRFIAPYVDGRDLRGPVVVSHLFLAIGCAVPLWFSLAGLHREDDAGGAWKSWETKDGARDVGMLAGVICVGMGDAAASLIGRRYGRRKWIWVGGKSLEGSAAFASAVTLGLLFGKIWLWMGGWHDVEPLHSTLDWAIWMVKAISCACGASFMEAVLTGANDNVTCPVALWLLVRGMRL